MFYFISYTSGAKSGYFVKKKWDAIRLRAKKNEKTYRLRPRAPRPILLCRILQIIFK